MIFSNKSPSVDGFYWVQFEGFDDISIVSLENGWVSFFGNEDDLRLHHKYNSGILWGDKIEIPPIEPNAVGVDETEK